MRQTVERRALLSWRCDVIFSSFSYERETETKSTARVVSHPPLHQRCCAAFNVGVDNRAFSKVPHESRFNLWDQDGRIRVRRSAGERCLPECVIEQHNGLTPGVMISGAISYHRRFNLLRIEGIPGAIFQQSNAARPHVAKTVRELCSAQHMQLLPWPAYSPDMSPIEYVWNLVGRHQARNPCLAASKNGTFAAHTSNKEFSSTSRHSKLFDSMPRRIAQHLLYRVVAAPNNDYGHLILFFFLL
ncbi:transposable element Tcb1 transposase [Trichonephila clavipes]|nr:transposable element Tcb1 transposase [Trichonephila clavipes]